MWSINLLSESFKYVAPVAFTFHDGSINCKFATTYSTGYAEFTFHNVSINTKKLVDFGKSCLDLFTFHNVSINTRTAEADETDGDNFTFHNVSINTAP